MTEYWESRFKNEKEMWGFEPADSSIAAVDMFRSLNFKNILIPGFGYGRNAKLFLDEGFCVTGIEISGSAIYLAKENGLNCSVYQGSVTSMPFDSQIYDGIFCYAVIHLLKKSDRKIFLRSCYNQLKDGGIMIFIVSSVHTSMFGRGKYISRNRYRLTKGLYVFFYDSDSISDEFSEFGLIECRDIEEPVKFMTGQEPLKLNFVVCKKD